jgi:tetratricopeptide (TPR) repeat protein
VSRPPGSRTRARRVWIPGRSLILVLFAMMLSMTLPTQLSRRPVLHIPLLLFSLVCSGYAQSTAPADPGRTALERGDYSAAETAYRNALHLNPKSPELLTDLGISLQLQRRSTDAIDAFEQALKLKSLPQTYALLAEEKCKTRDLDGARPMLAQILTTDPLDQRNLALVAPCYLELDEPVESIQAYSALLTDPGFPSDLTMVQLAKSYLLSAQFFFGKLATAPGNAIYIQALKNARDHASRDARGAFPEATRNSTYFNPNISFLDAVQLWRQHPDDTALLYLLSVLSGEESIRQIELCEDRFPDSPYMQQLRFEMLADQGHEDEAIQGYQHLQQTHPELPELRYSLGMLYREQRMWEQALAEFREQLARDPHDEQSAARVSEALVELTQWTHLREFLEPWVKRRTPPLWAVLDMAEALQNLGDLPRAIQLLAAAEKNNMSNKSIHFRLLILYRKTGNLAQAQAENKWLHSAS